MSRKARNREPDVCGWNLGVSFAVVFLLTASSHGQVSRQAAPDQPAAAQARPAQEAGRPPLIVRTSPAVSTTDVDPETSAITVTFDTDMGGGMSWTGGGPAFPKGREGMKPHWRDKRTCVFPATLEKGSYYRIGINSTSYQNFRSAKGIPARPTAIYFTTRGASDELKARVIKPTVAKMEPPNGAKDVDPNLREIRVTFSAAMGGGFSWTGGGPNFPTIPSGARPSWSADRKTAILPVQLQPNWDYRLGLNSPSNKNFSSEWGVPLDPVVYTFHTAGGAGR